MLTCTKRRVTLLILLTVLVLSVSACGLSEQPATDETLHALQAIDPLHSEWVQLKKAYQGIVAVHATPTASPTYQIGDRETFWVSRDVLAGQYEQVAVTLRYANEVMYAWVEEGITWQNGAPIADADLKTVGDLFADQIYPTTRDALGSEPNPGMDNDPHLHIVFLRLQGAGAYFSDGDQLPAAAYRYSNLREVLYVDASSYAANADGVLGAALAHEFAHMIHYHQNPDGEADWITEGLAVLSEELNGYDSWMEAEFESRLDVQLNAHRIYPQDEWVAHYGADHAFLSYLYHRFGSAFMRDIAASDTQDIHTVQQALDRHAPGTTFDQVFADWAAAYFIEQNPGDPRTQDPGEIRVPVTLVERYPQRGSETVHQYAADYYILMPQNGQEVTFAFDGAVSAAVLPTRARSGRYMWWAGRFNNDAALTRQVDLRQVEKAVLRFSAWYDLYDDYQYVYVSASTDGGASWKTLRGRHTTDENPNDANMGSGLTCKSGIGCGKEAQTPRWVDEEVDLSAYAGQTILLRFHYVGGSGNSGVAIDDIEIPAIGLADDAESDAGGWEAAGFARIDNRLPQRYIVQVIEMGPTVQTVRLDLDEQNQGSYTTHGLGDSLSRVVVVVSGATPFTWEPAGYRYQARVAR